MAYTDGEYKLMKKRVKVSMIANNFEINGISSVIMNFCRYVDKNKFTITIIAGEPVNEEYVQECCELGINVILLPSRKKSTKKYYMDLNREMHKGNYDIVHVHGNSATITMELAIAWLHGVKVRIAHCHSSTCYYMRSHKLMLPLFNRLYTNGFACSSLAGNWLFSEGCYDIIQNGFNTKKFIFNPIDRDRIRKELELEGKFVIGHVGRFNYSKNHEYLLAVFELIAVDYENVVLLLIGNGPDFKKVRDKANRSPYSKRIIIYGEASKTEKLYSAMDMFAFPSRCEGLGIVMLEAQISGLPCVASDAVPREVAVCPNVYFLPIDETNIITWKNQMIDIMRKEYNREKFFELYQDDISKYNITDCARFLEQKYMELVNLTN